MTLEFKVTSGRKEDGSWWARLDGKTHYAVGSGDDAWTAIDNAIDEASMLVDDEQRAHSEGVTP